MNLWSMSVTGGIFILAIVIIRSLFKDKLPRKVFQVLWFAAVLRLLLPFSIPSIFSIYSWMADFISISYNSTEKSISDMLPFWEQVRTDSQEEAEVWNSCEPLAEEENNFGQMAEEYSCSPAIGEQDCYGQVIVSGTAAEQKTFSTPLKNVFAGWLFLYWAGAFICALYYLISYIRCLREFQTSLPVEKRALQEQVNALSIRRKVMVRQWDLGTAPLTYGIFHPVILLPKTLMQEDQQQINFVLIHEYMHIRSLDALKKIILVVVCCIHWFNPLVWVMRMFADRDIELACDQNVVRYLGQETRSAYARTLIYMEEKRNVRITWGSSFSKNAMEERIVAIMREKKESIIIGILSGVLSAGLVLVFTTSAISARDRGYAYTVADESVESGMWNQAAYSSKEETVSETTESGEWPVQQDLGTAVYDTSYESSSGRAEAIAQESTLSETVYDASHESSSGRAEAIAQEQMEGTAVSVPPEYASYGITADDRTGGWRYDGREVAVFYDKGNHLFTNQVSSKKVVYLQVNRDSKGSIKNIQEVDKKQMQKLLKDTGLVFE